MATVYHPTFPDVSYDVSEKEVKKWLKAGWLKSPLEPAGDPAHEETPIEVDPERTPA